MCVFVKQFNIKIDLYDLDGLKNRLLLDLKT
ncbi:MAG: hypothetical protein ACI9M1_000389 [Porticoccaceae bacterium]|jgi:hypothetical protein